MFRNPFNEFVKAIKSDNRVVVETKFNPEFLNKPDNEGYYPIHLACINNAVDVFNYFLKQNCDIELLDSRGNRPIYHAIKNGSVEIVKLLLGYQCSFDNGDAFLEIAKKASKNRENTIEVVEKAIENRQIGIEMDLKCSFDCDHEFCLISFMMIEFDKTDVIACERFAKVFKVVESKRNRVFAVKKVTWEQDQADNFPENENSIYEIKKDAKWLENNINEYKTLLSHQHIIKYFGAIKEDYKLFIFMEFAENGSIHELIQTKYTDGLPYDKIIKYSKHILLALDYLHQMKILHRDVKPANILLDKDDICKLTDLGFSRLLETINKKDNSRKQKDAKTYCGTPHYMAPEIIKGKPYSFPCDLWSFGATVIEMLTGKPPYYRMKENQIIYKIGTGEKYDYESLRSTKEPLKRFIDQLVSFEPGDRKTATELLKLDLFQNVTRILIVSYK